MPAPTVSSYRPRHVARVVWSIVGIAALLIGIWSFWSPDASGSDVLIVIEDASETPTGLFPGTVCYKLIRQSDEVAVSQGCLAIAASISAPAGFDRNDLYTLEVSVNHPACTLLDDARSGNGMTPFRIRVTCQGLNDGKTDAADSAGPDQRDIPFFAPGASPIAIPITTGP